MAATYRVKIYPKSTYHKVQRSLEAIDFFIVEYVFLKNIPIFEEKQAKNMGKSMLPNHNRYRFLVASARSRQSGRLAEAIGDDYATVAEE